MTRIALEGHTRAVDVETSDRTWAQQVGAALTEEGASQLLGMSVADLRRAGGLLRIRNRDGQVVYPVMQFEAERRRQVPGVADVVTALAPALEPLGVAAWLTAHNRQLDARPLDVLRGGDVERVLTMAHQLANDAGH